MRDDGEWREVVDGGCLALTLASLLGGIAGTTAIAGIVFHLSPEGFTAQSLGESLLLGLLYGLPTSVLVGIGLVLFGIPLSRLFGERLVGRFGWILALACSLACGAVFLAFLMLLFGGNPFDARENTGLFALTPVYSVPAGMSWWAMLRKRHLR